MGVYVVTVLSWDATGNGWYHEVAVLAHTKRSAQVMASRALTKAGHTGAHSEDIREVDHFKTGVVLVRRKEAYPDAFAGSGQQA